MVLRSFRARAHLEARGYDWDLPVSEGEGWQIQIKNSIGIDLDLSSADKRSVRRIGKYNGGCGLESVRFNVVRDIRYPKRESTLKYVAGMWLILLVQQLYRTLKKPAENVTNGGH